MPDIRQSAARTAATIKRKKISTHYLEDRCPLTQRAQEAKDAAGADLKAGLITEAQYWNRVYSIAFSNAEVYEWPFDDFMKYVKYIAGYYPDPDKITPAFMKLAAVVLLAEAVSYNSIALWAHDNGMDDVAPWDVAAAAEKPHGQEKEEKLKALWQTRFVCCLHDMLTAYMSPDELEEARHEMEAEAARTKKAAVKAGGRKNAQKAREIPQSLKTANTEAANLTMQALASINTGRFNTGRSLAAHSTIYSAETYSAINDPQKCVTRYESVKDTKKKTKKFVAVSLDSSYFPMNYTETVRKDGKPGALVANRQRTPNVAKLFSYLSYRIYEDITPYNREIFISFQELADVGIYTSADSARKHAIYAMKALAHGISIDAGTISASGGRSLKFTGNFIDYAEREPGGIRVRLADGEKRVHELFTKYVKVLPVWAYRLGPRPFRLADTIYGSLRTNEKRETRQLPGASDPAGSVADPSTTTRSHATEPDVITFSVSVYKAMEAMGIYPPEDKTTETGAAYWRRFSMYVAQPLKEAAEEINKAAKAARLAEGSNQIQADPVNQGDTQRPDYVQDQDIYITLDAPAFDKRKPEKWLKAARFVCEVPKASDSYKYLETVKERREKKETRVSQRMKEKEIKQLEKLAELKGLNGVNFDPEGGQN